MKFTEYISTHQVFTTSELLPAVDSTAAAEQQLFLAVRSGSVERARRGLHVSNRGRYEGVPVEPYDIVSKADPNAVLCLHSALEAHGVAHNVGFECQFLSAVARTPFEFRGVRYAPCGSVGATRSADVKGAAVRRRATTREQTVLDCLGSPGKAGGPEEVVRSVTALAYLDAAGLADMACAAGPSSAARVGWLLSAKSDDWHVGKAVLQRLRGAVSSGPHRFGRALEGESGFSAEWRLVLPAPNAEVESWIVRL